MIKELEQSYKRLLSTKEKLVERITSASKEQQLFKSSENSWSMVEMLEHIMISESGILSFLERHPPAQSTYKVSLKNQ